MHVLSNSILKGLRRKTSGTMSNQALKSWFVNTIPPLKGTKPLGKNRQLQDGAG